MASRWDVAVYDRNDHLILVIEAKNRIGVAPEWAGRLRRNILAHGVYPTAPFFLIAFPDHFYLWTPSTAPPDRVTPDYAIDARPLLQPYFESTGTDEDHISAQSFEHIVTTWISGVIHSDKSSDEYSPNEKWLIESGLHAAIVGGRVEHEVLA